MTDEREFFSPEQVDAQIDHLSRHEQPSSGQFRQPTIPPFQPPGRQVRETRSAYQIERGAGDPFQDERRLVRDLQGYYQAEQQADRASLARAWKRVAPHLAANPERPHMVDKQPSSSEMSRVLQERNLPMYSQASERSVQRRGRRWIGLLAAVLVMIVLVGGLTAALVFSRAAQTPAGSQVGTTGKSTPTPAPTEAPGTTVYSTQAGNTVYNGFSWSPDSQRIAAFAQSSVQIWDATTGKHAVTYNLPGQNEWIYGLAWSPAGQTIAVATNQRILLIDGQTGQLLRKLSSSQASIVTPASPYLSSLLPQSGGFGYRALSWSPDGKYLAASISFGPSGSLQVWDVQASSVKYTLSFGAGYVISSVAWSSDGQYLAVHAYNTQGADPSVPSDIISAWNTTTHHEIFHQKIAMDGSDAPLLWQPRTHNLVFGAIHNGTGLYLEIWDALANKRVQSFAGLGNDLMTFSPDGRHLAYASGVPDGKSFRNVVIIIDVSSGAKLYTTQNENGGDTSPAWSPDGKYIVSACGGQQVLGKNGMPVIKDGQPEITPAYVRVWVAA